MSRFKVGDKVYMRHDPEECGVVVAIKVDNYKRPYAVQNGSFVDMCSECELLGAKEAFLLRLQSLLREFDAFLIAHSPAKSVSAYLGDSEITFASLGKEQNRGCGVVITADNIMDFDKE